MNTAGGTPESAWWRPVVIGTAIVVLAVTLVFTFWQLVRPLALLFAAVVIAQALSPAVVALTNRVPKMNRVIAVSLIYLIFAVVVGVAAGFTIPPVVNQAQMIAENAPGFFADVQDVADEWIPGWENAAVDAAQNAVNILSGFLVALPMTLFTSVTEILIVLFVSAYWLITTPALMRFVLSLFPPTQHEHIVDVLDETGGTMGGYIRGQVIGGVIVGTLTYIGLTIIGVNYALILALIAGVAELIPVIGPIIAAVPALVVALLESPTQFVIVLGFYIVLQQVESNLIMPNVMKRQADVPAILALLAVFAGGTVGGLLGALIAIPFAGAVRVLIIRVAAPAIRRWTGAPPRTRHEAEEGVEPTPDKPRQPVNI